MKFKSGRGGWREGGGRPKGSTMPAHLRRVNLNDFRLPQWIVDWLKSQDYSGGRLIEEALIKHYKLKHPDDKRVLKRKPTKKKRR
jgi:hypothetical protein